MQSKRSLAAVALSLAAGLMSTGAQAAVTYDFTALSSTAFSGETFTGSFSVTLPDFITAQTSFPATDLASCSVVASSGPATCQAANFLYGISPGQEVIALQVGTAANPGTQVFYYFQAGSLEKAGSYKSDVLVGQQDATLTVSGVSAVPEPASLPLMIAGGGLLAAAMRRKRA